MIQDTHSIIEGIEMALELNYSYSDDGANNRSQNEFDLILKVFSPCLNIFEGFDVIK